MAWFTRFSRFGDMHFVFGQEQGMLCGPASARMCYTKINKLSPGAALYGTTKKIQDLYARWLGSAYDGATEGTWPEGLVHALNNLNCGRWRKDSYAPNDAAQAIAYFVGTRGAVGPAVDVSPVIVGVNWDGSTASHWVCVDTVRNAFGNLYATVCDPWDAGLHVQKMTIGKAFVYSADTTLGVDLWGTHFSYDQPSTGRVKDWPIIHLVR